jgi:molecular chaperone GrpE
MAEDQTREADAAAETDATSDGDAASRAESVAREEAAALQDRLYRALADLENARKRHIRDAERIQSTERARVAGEWLPVLDNLELALEHADSDPAAIVAGVRAVREQALAVLDRLGYPRRDDVGARFDPNRHEAISSVVDDEVAPGTVVHVVRPGYGGDEHLLRPASVVVAAKDS